MAPHDAHPARPRSGRRRPGQPLNFAVSTTEVARVRGTREFAKGADSKAEPATAGAGAKVPAGKRAPLCTAAAKVIQMAVRDDCSADELGQLVTTDPALGLRVLAVVNSAAFMLPNHISNVRQAVALIGGRGLRTLALSLVVSDMAPVSAQGQLLLANSLRRALAAQYIAKALGVRQADTFFTAGLLLDVGLLVEARDDMDYAAQIARGPAAHRVVREQAAGHKAHPEVGAELALEYKLAEETVDAIAHHHDKKIPRTELGRVCWLAERFAGVYEGGDMVEAKRQALLAATRVGLEEEDAERILRALPGHVKTAAAAFNRDVGVQPNFEALIQDANKSLVSMNQHYEQLIRQLQVLIDEKAELERELRAANAQLATDATTDMLTGLPNKRALQATLERDLAQARRDQTPLSLVVIDVDHFKKFNDTWGHATGDLVLAGVGRLLLELVRAGDLPARYGGEEFVVILPNTDGPGARVAAERIRAELEGMAVQGPEGALNVTASLGVATLKGPGSDDSPGTLFERADAALYQAKDGGRNTVCLAA